MSCVDCPITETAAKALYLSSGVKFQRHFSYTDIQSFIIVIITIIIIIP